MPRNIVILGLGGVAEAGKDAFADFLVEIHGWNKSFFSKPLNDALMTLDPIVPVKRPAEMRVDYQTYSQLVKQVGYTEAKRNPEVRRLLQIMGTELGRDMFGEDVWCNLLERELWPLTNNTVVTGVRFRNELDWLHEAGGKAAYVLRPGFEALNAHKSEHSLKPEDFDYTIYNDGTLADLRKNAAQFHHTVTR